MKVQNNNFEILYFTCRSSTPLLSSAFNSSNMLLSIPKGQHRKILDMKNKINNYFSVDMKNIFVEEESV